MNETTYLAEYHRGGRHWVIDVNGCDRGRTPFRVGTTQAPLFRRAVRAAAVDLIEALTGERSPDVRAVRVR